MSSLTSSGEKSRNREREMFDDVEDKWVVVPEDMVISKNEIEEAIYFQEKYYHYEIEM